MRFISAASSPRLFNLITFLTATKIRRTVGNSPPTFQRTSFIIKTDKIDTTPPTHLFQWNQFNNITSPSWTYWVNSTFHGCVSFMPWYWSSWIRRRSMSSQRSSIRSFFLLKNFAPLRRGDRTRRHLDSLTTILTVPNTDPIIGTPSVQGDVSLIQNRFDERGKRWRGYATRCLSMLRNLLANKERKKSKRSWQ